MIRTTAPSNPLGRIMPLLDALEAAPSRVLSALRGHIHRGRAAGNRTGAEQMTNSNPLKTNIADCSPPGAGRGFSSGLKSPTEPCNSLDFSARLEAWNRQLMPERDTNTTQPLGNGPDGVHIATPRYEEAYRAILAAIAKAEGRDA